MEEFQRRKKYRQYLGSPILLLVLLVAFVFLGRATYKIFQKERQNSRDLALLAVRYDETSKKSDYLKAEIARLETSRGVDEEIRTKFGLAKEGEKMVVIVEPDKSAEEDVVSQKQSVWNRFLSFFGIK